MEERLDLGVMGSSLTLGVEITKKKKERNFKKGGEEVRLRED